MYHQISSNVFYWKIRKAILFIYSSIENDLNEIPFVENLYLFTKVCTPLRKGEQPDLKQQIFSP